MNDAPFYFFPRQSDGNKPAGVTISKRKKLPAGDFGITEYTWPDAVLWFVDADDFSDAERQEAHAWLKRINFACEGYHPKWRKP